MSVYETIKMSPLLGLQGSGGGLAYLAGLAGGGKTYVDDVFSTFLYKGNGGTQTITNGIDLSGEGGLTWVKQRNAARGHNLCDTERGATKILSSNNTSGEGTYSTTITGFANTGFSVGSDSGVNHSTGTYTSWTFRKAPGFFDVVKWTGNGSSGLRAINHNLGSTPGFIITKNATSGNTWACWHKDLNSKNYYLQLSETDQERNGSQQIWDATDTTFSIHSGITGNISGSTYVAYLFASDEASFGTGGDESIIKCGKYTGNGSTTGTVVNLGFEPQFMLMKNITRGSQWMMFDNMRGIANGGNDNYLHPSDTDAEYTAADYLNLTTTGFQLKSTATTVNQNGDSYIYMAIHRPNKPPTAATEVFYVTTNSTDATNILYTSGFPVDFHLQKSNGGSQTYVSTRLMGRYYIATSRNNGENLYNSTNLDSNTQFSGIGAYGASDGPHTFYAFKRAPGFMDVVAYTGNGVTRTINHNLTVKPELMLFKIRSHSFNWITYDKVNGATKYMSSNSDNGGIVSSSMFNNTEPTSSVFTVAGASGNVNYDGGDLIAYLFATLPGISKVGSYAGTGYAVNVNCGFTNGARFILIKRTNTGTTGDWYVWDAANGIVSGNDPYYTINNTAARVTNTDYVDPLTSGFTVTASAPAALNASGGTYLFLAIA